MLTIYHKLAALFSPWLVFPNSKSCSYIDFNLSSTRSGYQRIAHMLNIRSELCDAIVIQKLER